MNTKKALFVLAVFAVVMGLGVSSANGSVIIPANENAKNSAKGPEKSPVIGENWDLVRVDFIHPAKPSTPGAKAPKSASCYKLMGVKWLETNIDYAINPANSEGISDAEAAQTIAKSAETWDAATSNELFNDSYAVDYSAQYGVQDYKNSIQFGSYPDENAIAVTSVWYTRVGKQIVEFDMLFNDRFNWGNADINPALMDLENIATHEMGHTVGMADIYTSSCGTVTMYGYGTEGETAKRTLEQPDINGLVKMYGI